MIAKLRGESNRRLHCLVIRFLLGLRKEVLFLRLSYPKEGEFFQNKLMGES